MRSLIIIFLSLICFTYGSEFKNEVIVMFKDGSITGTSAGKTVISKLSVPEDKDVYQFIEELKKRDDILYAEPNYILRKVALPDDPDFYDLDGNPKWWWSVINAPEAWNVSTGSETVYIAVVDTGVDYNHPDLKNNLWMNTGELLGKDDNANGIDDGCENVDDGDGNGFIDDCYGINALCYQYDQNGNLIFNDGLSGCNTPDAYDDDGHGTHVAGIIGAVTNNGLGVAGVNWNVKIVPCKFLDASGNGSLDGEMICLDYLKKLKEDKGLNIIALNASYGGEYPPSDIERTKISWLPEILFISAAGNEGKNNEVIDFHPCNYDLDNQICVGASDSTNNRAYFNGVLSSNYGVSKVKLFAPGKEILSTYAGNQYVLISGTSQAAPFVSGAVGLIFSVNNSLTISQIKNKILFSGKNHPDKLSGYSYTCNVLNLYNLFIDNLDEKICLDRLSHNFGDTAVNTVKTETITVRNTGEVDLNVSSIYTNNGNFTVSEDCTAGPIKSNSTCTINVSFKPTLTDYYIGTLFVNYGSGSTLTVKLEGNGVPQTKSSVIFPTIEGSEGCRLSSGNDFGIITVYILLIISMLIRRKIRKDD
ncbi:S8 family serine peptidase [Persephonella sp.]